MASPASPQRADPFAALAPRLAQAWAALWYVAQPYPADEALAAQLRAGQLRKVAHLGQATLPAQMLCALALAGMMKDVHPTYCVVWTGLLALLCAVATLRMRRNFGLKAASKANLLAGTIVILIGAGLWGSLPIFMLKLTWESEDIPILLAMVGVACGGAIVFQSMPLAAAGWVLILSACTVIGMWMDNFVHMPGILGGALLLVGVLLRNIWMTSAQFFASRNLLNQANHLAHSLSQHALIVENTSNGVVMLDACHRITWINPGFVLQSGYGMSDAIGQAPGDWLPPQERGVVGEALRKRLDEPTQAPVELRYRHRDGHWVWAHADVKRLSDVPQGDSRYVLVLTDITDLKRAEQALRTEQERQRHIIDGTHCGTWEMDIDGGRCAIDGRWLDIIGVDTPALLVTTANFLLDRIHPDDRDGHRKATQHYLKGLTPQFAHEHRLRHEDGSWRWVTARGKASAYDDQGRITRMSGISMDISNSKATEHALIDATRLAKQANHAKSLFLATMSHEIRTPMNGVIGTAEWLKVTPLAEEQRDGIQTIVDSGRALLTIIDDILDFTKIEAGRMKLEEVAWSPLELAEGVANAIAPVAINKHVELHVFVDPRLPARVMGDVTRLRQVLFNLVGNAVKFGAGTAQKPGQVDMQLVVSEDDESTWQMQVSDDGIGMSTETLCKLFKPFMQAEAATTRRFGGTGLGLAICHRLVELMCGGIVAHSVQGHGATFLVTLPLVPAEEDAPSPLSHFNLAGVDCALLNGRHYRCDNLAAYLGHAGANVHVCMSDAEAREVAKALPLLVLIGDAPEGCPVADDDVLAQAGVVQDSWGAHVRHLWVGKHRRGPLRLISPAVGLLGRAHARDLLRAVAELTGKPFPELSRGEPLGLAVSPNHPAGLGQPMPLAPYRILVAEDDPTNQKVVRRQLNTLGYACELADNGRAALERWRSEGFDILLSDLHMPELDGYELAQHIRAHEADLGLPRMPILALTANALAGEQIRARECGVDDYLTKPISLEGLQAALTQWLPCGQPGHRQAPLPSSVAPAQALSEAPVDVNVLKQLVGDDEDIVRELLHDFVLSARQIGASLREARDMQSPEVVRKLAHQLKSAARSVGALRLGQLCQLCELAAQHPAALSEPLQDVLQELQMVQDQLDNLIQEPHHD